MDFTGIPEKTWIFNERGGKNYDLATVGPRGIRWQSWSGAPQLDYDLEREFAQTLEDFIVHGSSFVPLHGPIPKGLRSELLRYLADYARTAGQLRDTWECDGRFVRIDGDHLIAGSSRGSFPGGDVANAWPLKKLSADTINEIAGQVDPALVRDVVLTIRLREYVS